MDEAVEDMKAKAKETADNVKECMEEKVDKVKNKSRKISQKNAIV